MAEKEPIFFISYSSKDRRPAEALANRLRSLGAQVWVDYEQVKLGDPILTRIAEGLSEATALLFLVSQHSGESPWCRKEYETALQREIISGRTAVVPIRLDDSPLPILLNDKRYLRFADLNQCLPELLACAESGGEPTTGLSDRPMPQTLPSGLLEGLTLLLLLDQFPVGVWGRSLTPLGAAYGHAEDPGSITVSSWSADALRELQPAGEVPEIDLFSQYLNDRRRTDTGAVGMRRRVGSSFAEEYRIIENRRHTAVAALYLHKHCNALDQALQSLRFVMESRTARGGWTAIGQPTDENADPLTTGYVLGVLRTFERANLLAAVGIEQRDLFLARYWKAGLLWLYENLLENAGWWRYKDEKRTYCYTTDILLAVPEFWLEDPDYEKAHESLVTRLFDIWQANGSGIPSGPTSQTPNLEATAQFAAVLWMCRIRYPDLNSEVQKHFAANLEAILAVGESDAAGWALAITHLVRVLGARLSPDCGLSRLRELVFVVEQRCSASDAATLHDTKLPPWVSSIASNRILTVNVDPP